MVGIQTYFKVGVVNEKKEKVFISQYDEICIAEYWAKEFEKMTNCKSYIEKAYKKIR